MAISPPDDDAPALAALDKAADTLEVTAGQQRRLARRLKALREGVSRGRSWRELMGHQRGRDLLASMVAIGATAAAAIAEARRAIASALRAEGIGTQEIAGLFGVSHQRASKMLRPPPPEATAPDPTREG